MMGLFLEDFREGQRFDLGTYVFNEEAISAFSSAFVPVGFHTDTAAAAEGIFGGTVAAGWHICCGWMARFVATNSHERERVAAAGGVLPEIGPSPGISNLRWPAPVHAGDAIHYGVTITGARALKSRPGWGMVAIAADGCKADGTTVMSFAGNVMVALKGSGS